MVFKSLKRALGVGGPTVDTVLGSPDVQPGGYVSGQVRFAGGEHEVEVERITVALQTRVEVEGADSEYDATVEFQRLQLTGRTRGSGARTGVRAPLLRVPCRKRAEDASIIEVLRLRWLP